MTEAVLSRLDAPEKFLNEWAALFAQAEEPTFFQSPEWMTAWLENIPAETDLYSIRIADAAGPKLLGVVSYRARRTPSVVGFSEARLHEFGVAAHDAVYLEYNDFLMAPGAALHRVTALVALLDQFENCDSIVFRNVAPAMLQSIEELAQSRSLGLRLLNVQPVYGCDLAALRDSDQAPLDAFSSSLRTKIRRSIAAYEERGDVTAQVAKTDAEKAQSWDALLSLHAAGWAARGESGVFANPHLSAFHERLRAAAPEAVELFTVKAGDQMIGVLYNFVQGDRVMNYQSGFFYEGDNHLAPGFVSHALACQSYLERGFALYDFLAGDAEYKKRLGAQHDILTSVAIDRPSWRRKARNLIRGSGLPRP